MAPVGHEGPARRCLEAVSALRHLASGGTRHPPSGLEVGNAWRYVSFTRQFCCSSLWLLVLHAWSTRLLGYFKGGLLVFIYLSLERIPWVELGIGVKHVAFLELSSEWRPSSWTRDGGWTRGTLELSLGWRILPVWVCWLWPIRMKIALL